MELIEKLAALIPPRRLNLVRYHGILAPNARDRPQVVPAPPSPPVPPADGDSPAPPLRPHRLTWAALLARVFALDVTVCPTCGGRLRWIAALTDPASVRRYPWAYTKHMQLRATPIMPMPQISLQNF